MKKRDITRREFLKGAGAVTLGVAAMSLFGGCATESGSAGGGSKAGGKTVLAFASDQHAETAGFDAWLADQQAVFGDELSHLSFAGDICDKEWNQEVFDGFKAVLDTRMPGKYAVTTGNQENKAGAPGADWDALGDGFVRLGEAAGTDDYKIYHLGAAQEAMNFPQADIDALAAYLSAAPADIPVFVVSHFPLHLSVATATHSIPGGDHRQAENNAALIEVLNAHPNVIFLWGHNHTFQDPRYGTIRPTGSKFTYDYYNPTEKIGIGFTYANIGSFCRGDTYGLIAEISRDSAGVTAKLYYVDTNVPMETKDSAVLTFSGSAVGVNITPGTAINLAEAQAMSGYPDDPNFTGEY